MTILLDIDGVLVTTPIWQKVELLSDGFMKFNEVAVENLAILFQQTNATIILTTTHRIQYHENQWKEIFKLRGLNFHTILKLNNQTEISHLANRATEIQEWVNTIPSNFNYVILDDDLSINNLSNTIKKRWVCTKPMIGFNREAREKAFDILTQKI